MAWQNEQTSRREIVEVHRQLYQLGFSVANDGNTSVRLDRDRILITPAGLNKARLQPNQLAVVDAKGKHVGGSYPPSSEIAVHVGIYQARPDVRAIIHAHPPYCIACSLAGISLADCVLPEVVLSLGAIPTTPYVTPSSREGGDVVAELMKEYDAIVLDRHGTVTVGKTLEEAMSKLERVEHTAKITAIARSMGHVAPLPKSEVDRLIAKAKEMGVQHGKDLCTECGGCGMAKKEEGDPQQKVDSSLIDLITREVLSELSKRPPIS